MAIFFYHPLRALLAIVVVSSFSACQSTDSSPDASISSANLTTGQVIIHATVNGKMCGSLYTSYIVIGPNGTRHDIQNGVYLFQNMPKLAVTSLAPGSYRLTQITCPEVYEINSYGTLAIFDVVQGQVSNLGVLDMKSGTRNFSDLRKTTRQYTSAELKGFSKDNPQIASSMRYAPMQANPTVPSQ